MSRPKCLRCGAGAEWIEGRVPDEVSDGSFVAPTGSEKRVLRKAERLLDHEARCLRREPPSMDEADKEAKRSYEAMKLTAKELRRLASPSAELSDRMAAAKPSGSFFLERGRAVWRKEAEAAKELLDWAESLICNAVPMSHCTQDEWNEVVKKWRDAKHGVGGGKDSPNAKAERTRPREIEL